MAQGKGTSGPATQMRDLLYPGPGFWAALSFAALLLSAPAEASLARLPDPPRTAPNMAEVQLHLELIVNGLTTGHVARVVGRGGRFLVDAQDLRAVHLPVSQDGLVDIAGLEGVTASYDQGRQRLILSVPPAWMPGQKIGSDRGGNRLAAESSFGAMLTYDLYVADHDSGHTLASLWNEARIFGRFGVVKSSGIWRQNLRGKGAEHGYIRYDTTWTYVDDETVHTYEAGDLITRSLPWSGAVRLGGVQLSRDFSVRPDIITHPLPRFSGTAALPSTLDLFINGQRSSSNALAPGPFTITDMPYVNGAGEAVIVTTDATGREISTTLPFYVSSKLLRRGLSDYAVSAGVVRQKFGIRNFSYGEPAVSAALRHGLTDYLTLEGTVQASTGFMLGGTGAVVRLGQLGVAELSASLSQHNGQNGTQYVVGYQYNRQGFSLMARHVRRDEDFFDLAGLDGLLSPSPLPGDLDSVLAKPRRYLPRRQTMLNSSFSLGEGLGVLSAGYIETLHDSDQFEMATVSYHQPLWSNSSLLLSANHDFERDRSAFMVQFVLPLGNRGSAALGMERSAQGRYRQYANASRGTPMNGGFGWSAALARSQGGIMDYLADGIWRTPHAELRAGFQRRGRRDMRWASASGSLIAMDGGLFAANRVYDAFVLVSTDGVADIPVLYENQVAGLTNRNGHLIVPWARAYASGQYAIDTLDLAVTYSAPVTEMKASVRQGGGRLLRFPLTQSRSRSFVLQDKDGAPLPLGTVITADKGQRGWVGWEGLVYLEKLEDRNTLSATTPEGKRCTAVLTYAPEEQERGTIQCL